MDKIDTPTVYAGCMDAEEQHKEDIRSPLTAVMRLGPVHFLGQKSRVKAFPNNKALYVCYYKWCYMHPVQAHHTWADKHLVLNQLDENNFIRHDIAIKGGGQKTSTKLKQANNHLSEQGYLKCARFPVAIRIQSKARRIKYNRKARELFCG